MIITTRQSVSLLGFCSNKGLGGWPFTLGKRTRRRSEVIGYFPKITPQIGTVAVQLRGFCWMRGRHCWHPLALMAPQRATPRSPTPSNWLLITSVTATSKLAETRNFEGGSSPGQPCSGSLRAAGKNTLLGANWDPISLFWPCTAIKN
jgi:hypothetical protein